MRFLLGLLLWCLLGPGLWAQERQATVVLEDGRTVVGRVVEMEIDHLTLDVAGKQQTFASTQLRSCRIETLAAPGPSPAGEGAEGGLDSEEAQATSIPEPLRGSLFARRLQSLDRRYPWLSPTEPMQWISLGVALFVFASFSLHFASRLAGTEVNSFGRSVGVAFLLLLGGVAQVALVPMNGPFLFGMLLANTVVWVALLRFTFELPLAAASIAFVILLAETALGFGILEAVDAMMLSMGNTPV